LIFWFYRVLAYVSVPLDFRPHKRVERTYGSFYRRFSLPDTADGDAINAKCKHGVLEIIIPKREAVKPKRISVAAEE
jgi:HSP20 family protein